MQSNPVHILLSSHVRDEYGAQLAAIAQKERREIVLHTPTELENASLSTLAQLEAAFLSVDVLGDSSKTHLTPDMAIFCDLLDRAPRLAWVQVPSAGVDRPHFLDWMGRGVTLCNASGVAATAVAQSAVGGMLALARHMPMWMDAQRRGAWEPLRGPREPAILEEKTVMIVGLGAIGQEVARLCRALRMRVLGVSQSGVDRENVCDEAYPQSKMDDVLPDCDWIVVCCPLSEQTRGLFNDARLQKVRPGAGLIDVSRGGVVVEQALEAALDSGRIAKAYLDVFEKEPLPSQASFWTRSNVLMSPHSAGDFQGRHQKLCRLFCNNVERSLRGDPLINAVTS